MSSNTNNENTNEDIDITTIGTTTKVPRPSNKTTSKAWDYCTLLISTDTYLQLELISFTQAK